MWSLAEMRKGQLSEKAAELPVHWKGKRGRPTKKMEGQCKEGYGVQSTEGGRRSLPHQNRDLYINCVERKQFWTKCLPLENNDKVELP